MLDPCNTLTGNLSARGIHNSNCFIKCAFRLKKGAAVRELLLRKVWKVPFFRLRRKEGGQCSSCRVLKSVIAHMKMITKDWPRQCWRAPRIIFAFHWDSKKSELRDVCEKRVFRAPKNIHVSDVARLPFGQFVYSARATLMLSHKHHVNCAPEERTAFHYVFVEIEQKISGEIATRYECINRSCRTPVWGRRRSRFLFVFWKKVWVSNIAL